MTETNFRFFEFGEFRLDAHRRILQKNGETVHLTPRSFDLLCVMVENAGRVLEHDELLEKVWSGTFVEQGNLKKTVSVLRSALGESSEASEFIITVPRKGYRFSAPVRALPEDSILIRETRTEITIEEEEEDALDEVSLSLPAAPESKKNRPFRIHRLAIAALAFFALATIALTAWMFLRRQPQSFSVENVKTTKMTTEGISANSPAISADGKYLAYSIFHKGNSSLVVKQISTGSVTTLVPWQSNVGIWGYTFTPDNEYLYYTIRYFNEPSKNGLYKIPFLGGAPQRISDTDGVYLAFSPDGKRLAFTRILENFHNELVTISSDGGEERRVAQYDDKYRLWGVVWTSDGEALLCTLRKRNDDKIVYYVAEVSIADGTEKIILPEQTTYIISAVWLPDKQSLLLSMSEQNAIVRQIWQYFPASGEFRRVTNDNVSYWFLSLTKDGKTLATAQDIRPATIWTADIDFNNYRQMPVGVNEFTRAFWTADGKIVYQTTENRQEALWTIAPDGTQKKRITSGSNSYELNARMAPDGRTLTFASRSSGTSQIWRVDADGENLRQITDDLKTHGADAKLLADGQTLLYMAFVSPSGWTLFERKPGGQDRQLTNVTVEAWDTSPDESLLAYSGTDRQTKKNKIFVQKIESGEIIKTFEVRASSVLRWTRDGKSLIFGSRRDGSLSEIMIQPIDGSPPKIFNNSEPDRIMWLDLSPDGQNLLVVRANFQTDVVLIRAGEDR